MNEENILFIILTVGLIVFLGIFIFVNKSKTPSAPLPTPTPPQEVEVENPAARFCLENGGNLDIRSDREGNQKGFCIFEDGSECEEWSFFRGECKKGEKICRDLCGNGRCDEIVCMATGCPCPETRESCPRDCQI